MEAERQYKILIVDSESDVRTAYRTFFQQQGFDVETANDGQEALDKLLNGEFDVAIIDLQLPKLEGITLIQRAKAAGVDTSTIVIARHGERDDAIAALNAGVDYWFDKSEIEMDKLLNKVIELAQVIPLDEIDRLLSAIPTPD